MAAFCLQFAHIINIAYHVIPSSEIHIEFIVRLNRSILTGGHLIDEVLKIQILVNVKTAVTLSRFDSRIYGVSRYEMYVARTSNIRKHT